MLPRTIVSVLDSSDVVRDPAIAWASSLARWSEADLHVVHVRRAGRWTAAAADERRGALAGRIGQIVDASGSAGITVTPVVLTGRPVRAIAEYCRRVAADLAQRSGGRLELVYVASGFPYETVYSSGAATRLRRRLGAGVVQMNRELRRLVPPEATNWSRVETTTVAGDAREGILAAASRARADLIVVGLPGAPASRRS